MFKTSEKQMKLANRIVEIINAKYSDANATVNDKDGFITVGAHTRFQSWLIQVGVRGGLKDLYTKKSIGLNQVHYSYRVW